MGWQTLVARRVISSAESLDGPFHQPERPHPQVDLQAAIDASDSLEHLLFRAVRSRAKSLLFPLALAVTLALASSPSRDWSIALSLAAVGLLIGLFDHILGTGPFFTGRGGLATHLILEVLGPPLAEVAAAARALHDAIRGLAPVSRQELLGNLSRSHPLTAAAAESSWTLVPKSVRGEIGRRGLA